MYHQHPQQQGSQTFPNAPRPSHHQPPASQHLNRNNMQGMGFQFPRPNQLPDELESALSIRGGRDVDHRQIDHMNQPIQHQNQGSGSGIGQHGGYGSNPIPIPADNQPGHQQGVDWSSYQPPNKLFSSPPPNAGHQGTQQPQSNQAGARMLNWTPPISDLTLPQTRQSHGAGGGGEGQSLYTPESAGSILASFGLSNEDLEVLSHYPDDQLTPDTLPFILRDIQINKSGKQKTVASSSSSFSHNIHDMSMPPSHSPEVPSLLAVTQTAGKVIDYGHASRGKDESATRETFKREPLSSERTVKMYPATSSLAIPKVDNTERRQVCLKHKEPSKHEDRDYRRTSNEKHKISHSPGREFALSHKSRNLDRDYRNDGAKPRPSSESRNEGSSRRSLSSSSSSKLHGSTKKLPTPTMISDFSAVSPKVYPHTCSLCHIQCDQEKDWIDHINTVDHTAACRDLRNKYPDWKPNHPSKSGRYGSRALWDPKDGSPFQSVSRSRSRSPSPTQGRHRRGPYSPRPRGRPYSPHRHSRPHYISSGLHDRDRSRRFDHHRSHGPSYSQRTAVLSREYRPERMSRGSSGDFCHSGGKRPHGALTRGSADSSQNPTGHGSKREPSPPLTKSAKAAPKPGNKMTKTSVKPPPAKKKKKAAAPACQDLSVVDRLVYLTGIPKDATEQEVTDLAGTFGKINNVVLMPCSEEEDEKGQGQKASVCMMMAEDAKVLASASNLRIRDQEITASVAKKPEDGQHSDTNSKPDAENDKGAANDATVNTSAGGDADQKTPDQKCMVLITGLTESGWSNTDIIQLVQPFGTPSDIITATHIGKVLVSLPDAEVAQEMVKVHSLKPARINDAEVKMIVLRQHIGFNTPVALYNLFMGSQDPLENSAPVGWSSLLVIKNVPDTPTGPSEVIKLVRRFGTVIKTLVLKNMIMCEMATPAMALSVYKRFQTFPCIIQNNPLFFSRKADPKVSSQIKIIAACCDSSEDKPTNDNDDQSTTAATVREEETTHQESSETRLERDGDDNKMSLEEVRPDEPLGENGGTDDKKEEVGVPAASDTKPDADLVTDSRETLAAETETTEVNKTPVELDEGNTEEIKQPGCDDKPVSEERSMPELPKMTQAMVNVLLMECRTRTANHSNNTGAPLGGKQDQAQHEAEHKENTDETKDLTKSTTEEEEEEAKKQEKERKEREAKKERRERERRAWEKDRAKREKERAEKTRRERREEERREWERRERGRRERRRGYGEELSGSRLSYRFEGNKPSSWRDERHSVEAERRKEEEEECDEFPFNMSDFVTVDEVGDVTGLPHPLSPTVVMETSNEGGGAPVTDQQELPEDTPVESAVTQEKSEDVSESDGASGVKAESSDGLMEPDTPGQDSAPLASQAHCSPIKTLVLPGAPEAEPDTLVTASLEPTSDVEPLLTPAPAASADASSNSPVEGVAIVKTEEESDPTSQIQTKDEEEIKQEQNTPEEEKMELTDGAEKGGKPDKAEENTNTEEKTELKMDSIEKTDQLLPSYDPNSPVGMEYLVPKTGFFCKVCSRFFSGTKVAEINHCKTLKHYENLQKFLQTTK